MREALQALWTLHPGLRDRVVTEQGEIRSHINIFVGDESIRFARGLATPLPEESEISILPAISGGNEESAPSSLAPASPQRNPVSPRRVQLRRSTPSAWVETVLADFDAFLLDHAACERKASATAMNFVAHYPDRQELVAACIDLAREELQHFHDVYRWIASRGLILAPDTKDPYVGRLAQEYRKGSEAYFLDRLLVAGIVEARGCERFGLVAAALPSGPMKEFYGDIARSEARHQGLFLRLAGVYFDPETIATRLDQLLVIEARVIAELPLRPAVH